jgi:glycosyltransferase involved in cell wall biosynthesis
VKILHLSTFDLIGGAARAAYRVHEGLCTVGADSWMLVRKKVSDDYRVIGPRTKLNKWIGRVRAEIDGLALHPYSHGDNTAFHAAAVPERLLSKVNRIDPDIINLHYVLNGFLRIETLAKFNRPIVWTLMDMWSFTGGCNYTQGCTKYAQKCGACPVLGSTRESDLSRKTWQRKFKIWEDLDLTLVAPTHWLAACAKESSLFKHRRVEVIPFCLDTNCFKPIHQKKARAVLNLPFHKKLVTFGAVSATGDRRKGFHLLQPALQQLAQTELGQQIEVVVFGASAPKEPLDLGFKTHYLGHLDNTSLTLAYSAADIFVAPSLQEAFGQTASESMACGTPVVAFNGTGLADIIDHQQNGYLARPFDINDLARGITWVLEDPQRYQVLTTQARQKAESSFSLDLQGQSYKALYHDLLAEGPSVRTHISRDVSVKSKQSGIRQL